MDVASSLAPCPPLGLARLHERTTRGGVSMCPSSRELGEGVRGQVASGARAQGSRRALCGRGSAGFEAGLPELERMPERMESRPKAPWWEPGRLRRPTPHHGAASPGPLNTAHSHNARSHFQPAVRSSRMPGPPPLIGPSCDKSCQSLVPATPLPVVGRPSPLRSRWQNIPF